MKMKLLIAPEGIEIEVIDYVNRNEIGTFNRTRRN